MKLIGILCLCIAACVPLIGGEVYMSHSGSQQFTSIPTTGLYLGTNSSLQPNETINCSSVGLSCTASYAAYMSYGHLGLAMSNDVTKLGGEHYQNTDISINSRDRLAIGGVSSGFLRIHYRFDGSLQLTGTGAATSTLSEVFANWSIGSNGAGVSHYAKAIGTGTGVETLSSGGTLTELSSGNWGYIAEGFTDLVIESGQVVVYQRLTGKSSCRLYSGQSCTASLDFLNSALVGGAVVLDSSGVVQNATITSESGYDYTRALPSLVPEPTHYVTLAIGLMGLFAATSRRRALRTRR